MMDPEKIAHWQAADAAFDRWLDLPDSERDAWLATEPLPEPVRRRLAQLIIAHQQPRASLDPAGNNLAGCRLGEWTLDTELGRGGMAVVYRAWREQGMARQQAAVKILTLGALGATGRERFRREAAILARLNHPNVTALIDSGVADDGTFWLAMPLVDGERIDRWCEAHSPDAHAIVRLYLQVCGAVAYAHRNLVIHRDIKPSNVLVDDDGHVRLLDFGIGQFADAQGEQTQTMWRALTPGYAAPEQLAGAPPSTAVDVYGLGALLHRLLTGRTPQAATQSTDTTRPSLLVRDAGDAYHRHYVPLKNDLDRVLLKALAEEPEQRYATTEALADDLRRWLDGQPVLAQKPKLGYRVRKFMARNKAGVAASVLLAASLGAGVAATLWQASEARHEAENAKVQAQRAVLVRDFLSHVFESTEPASGGVPTALDLLEEGSRQAREEVMATDPTAAADILMLTGRARLELGQTDEALVDLAQARDLLAAQGTASYRERSRVEGDLGRLMRERGDLAAALAHGQTAVELAELDLAHQGDPGLLVEAKIRLAEGIFPTDPDASKAMFEEILQMLPQHGLEETTLHLMALSDMAVVMSVLDPDDHAREAADAEELIALSQRVNGPESSLHAYVLANHVSAFVASHDYARAEQLALEAVDLAERIYTKPHARKAYAHCALASYLDMRGRTLDARRHYGIAGEINTRLGTTGLGVESCYRNSGYVHAVLGDYEAALADMKRSWEILETYDSRTSAIGYTNCGVRSAIHLRRGDIDSAARVLDECPADDGSTPSNTWIQARAELHFARGEHAKAAEIAAGLRQAAPPREEDLHWMRPWMLSLLLAHDAGDTATAATVLAELGQFTAKPPLSRCVAEPTRANCLVLPKAGYTPANRPDGT